MKDVLNISKADLNSLIERAKGSNEQSRFQIQLMVVRCVRHGMAVKVQLTVTIVMVHIPDNYGWS